MNSLCCSSELNGAVSSQVDEISTASKDVKRELIMLSLPAIGGQAIDPIVLLLETAYIGRLGNLHILTYCFVSYYFYEFDVFFILTL